MTFRNLCGPALTGIDNLNASQVPPKINCGEKASGPAAYDKTVQHVAMGPHFGKVRSAKPIETSASFSSSRT